MGACCTKTADEQSHFNLNDESNDENIEIKKQLQQIKDEITNPTLNASYCSEAENNDLPFHKKEVERNRKFCQDILKEFNTMRTNPRAYLKKVEYYEQFVKYSNSNVVFEFENKIYQLNNSLAFEELNTFLDPLSELPPLEMKDDLIITIPSDPTQIQSYDYMANQFVMKKIGLSNKYTHFTFHYDLNSKNAELSAFFQLLDDANNNRQRRRNILNQVFTSVGISIGKVNEEKHVCYIVFAG